LGDTFALGESILLQAEAQDSDGTIERVRFLRGDSLLVTLTQPPYQYAWSPTDTGRYAISAIAVDNDGDSARTPARRVWVVPADSTPPPSDSSAIADLNVAASGDSLRLTWTLLAGRSEQEMYLLRSADGQAFAYLAQYSISADTSLQRFARIDAFPPPDSAWYRVELFSPADSLLSTQEVRYPPPPEDDGDPEEEPTPERGHHRLEAYPVPTQDWLFLELGVPAETPAQIILVNEFNATLLVEPWLLQTGTNYHRLPLDRFPRGLYFISVRYLGQDRVMGRRVVIE